MENLLVYKCCLTLKKLNKTTTTLNFFLWVKQAREWAVSFTSIVWRYQGASQAG